MGVIAGRIFRDGTQVNRLAINAGQRLAVENQLIWIFLVIGVITFQGNLELVNVGAAAGVVGFFALG